MNVIKTGIYNLFVATSGSPATHNSFYTAISGRQYFGEAPQGATFPYCAWGFVDKTDLINFTSDKNKVILQFDIVSNSSTSEEIGNLETYLKALYHRSSPTITGYRVVHMRWNTDRGPWRDPDNSWWMYQARFELKIEPSG